MKLRQKARKFVAEIGRLSAGRRLARDYILCGQLRRAALSIMNNVAEGFARKTNREFVHFLGIAHGSAGEVKSMLYVLLDLRLVDRPTFDRLDGACEELGKMSYALSRYLQTV